MSTNPWLFEPISAAACAAVQSVIDERDALRARLTQAERERDAARQRVAELVNDATIYRVPVDAAALLADLRDELDRTRAAFANDAAAMRQRIGELREAAHFFHAAHCPTCPDNPCELGLMLRAGISVSSYARAADNAPAAHEPKAGSARD